MPDWQQRRRASLAGQAKACPTPISDAMLFSRAILKSLPEHQWHHPLPASGPSR
jgi:hypothetical protein